MKRELSQLVVTPKPIYGEDILGYLLRTSEANGYISPAYLLKHAGIMSTNSHCKHIFDTKMLTPLLGTNGNTIEQIGYVIPEKAHEKHPSTIKLMGHHIYRHFTKLKTPKICPQCIEEKGYIESVWNLQLFVACPAHNIELVSYCPSCSKPLSQYRRELLRCRCGAYLNSMRGKKIRDKRVLGLLEIIKRKFYRSPLDINNKGFSSFPIEALDFISPNSLYRIIEMLGKMQLNIVAKSTDTANQNQLNDKHSVLKSAAKVLSHWPRGFHGLINEMRGQLNDGDVELLTKRFSPLYRFLFRSSIPREDLLFFQKEFLAYENSFIKSSLIDKRFKNALDGELQLIGITALSEELGIHPNTAHKLLHKGIIDAYAEMIDSRRRYVFDRSKTLPYKVAATENISERDAAKMLGLPVSVLKELRSRKIYKNFQIGDKLASYTKSCVADLEKRILLGINVVSMDAYDTNEHILLCEVMRMKLGSPAIKADFVCDFIKRKIKPLGVICSDIARIVFDKNEVDRYLNIRKSNHFRGPFLSKAAKMLRCDATIVALLVSDGYLDAHKNKRGMIVTEESLQNFASNYISCARVSEALKTSTNKIIFICEQKGIELISFVRQHAKSPQPFMHRKDIGEFGLESLPVYYSH